MSTIDLGVEAVDNLLDQADIPREQIDKIFWGDFIVPGYAPKMAREFALDLEFPPRVEGHTVSRACASGL